MRDSPSRSCRAPSRSRRRDSSARTFAPRGCRPGGATAEYRRRARSEPHSGQATAPRAATSSSNRAPHPSHSNSYIGIDRIVNADTGVSCFEYSAAMKARGGLAVLVGVLAACLALPGAAAAGGGNGAPVAVSEFKLAGTNGFAIDVTAIREGRSAPVAVVSADRGPVGAGYEVRADLGKGLHATFGSLGMLDVYFARGEKRVSHPERGCRWVTERGTFRGSFRFVGEGEYVSAEATDPAGEVFRLPDGFCGFEGLRPARIRIPGLYATSVAARAESEGRETTFIAQRPSFEHVTHFEASLKEWVGGMKITRTARAHGREGTFATTGKSKASVHPPAPFTGSAKFRDPAHRPPSWTGSLAVAFPGAPQTPLAGAGFTAKLCPRMSFLATCLR